MNISTTTAAAIAKLTKQGRATMEAIGNGQVSFFDGGVVEGEGCWGGILTEELGHKSSGVLNGLKKQGLMENWDQEDEYGDAGQWWILTALGAEVARLVAAPAVVEEDEDEDEDDEVPAVTVKKGSKWTYIYAADGSLIAELRNDSLGAIAAFLQN